MFGLDIVIYSTVSRLLVLNPDPAFDCILHKVTKLDLIHKPLILAILILFINDHF